MIIIKKITGETITLDHLDEISPWDTIERVKLKVQEKTGRFLPSCCRLSSPCRPSKVQKQTLTWADVAPSQWRWRPTHLTASGRLASHSLPTYLLTAAPANAACFLAALQASPLTGNGWCLPAGHLTTAAPWPTTRFTERACFTCSSEGRD